jgi:hypothetical protein
MDTWMEPSFTAGALKVASVGLVSKPAQEASTNPRANKKAIVNASLFFMIPPLSL